MTLEGVVDCNQHSHPNGSQFTFCTITLGQPRCVEGSGDEKSTQEVQLAGSTDFTTYKRGRVRVKGEAYPWHTAWHVRPVLITVEAIERR